MFTSLSETERAELQRVFNLPSTVFDALATGGPIDFTEWREHGEEGHSSGISDQAEEKSHQSQQPYFQIKGDHTNGDLYEASRNNRA